MAPSRLLALPAELRNHIFELAFTSASERCNLLQPHPPSNALLTCNHQLYRELKNMHEEACRHYFRDTPFFIEYWTPARSVNETGLQLLQRRQVLQTIKSLEISMVRWEEGFGSCEVKLTMIDLRGAWKVIGRDRTVWEYQFYVVITPSTTAETKGSAHDIERFETEAGAKEECASRSGVAAVDKQILAAIYCLGDWWLETSSRASGLLANAY